jgi:hypothetical protein
VEEGEVLVGGTMPGSTSRSCCHAASRWWVNDTFTLSPTYVGNVWDGIYQILGLGLLGDVGPREKENLAYL